MTVSTIKIVRGLYTPVQQTTVGKGKKKRTAFVPTGNIKMLVACNKRGFIDFRGCINAARGLKPDLGKVEIVPFSDVLHNRTFAFITLQP